MPPHPASDIIPQNLLKYWRASLADTALGKGRFSAYEIKNLSKLSGSACRDGVLDADLTAQIFEKQDAKIQELEICIWPLVLALKKSHGTVTSERLPAFVAPVVSAAKVDREGKIRPSEAVIARDLLAPLTEGAFAIGDLEKLDSFLTTSPFTSPSEGAEPAQMWEAYKDYCQQLIAVVTDNWPETATDYLPIGHGFLEVVASNAANQNIIKLYDAILDRTPATPLLTTYATALPRDVLAAPATASTIATRRGYCNDSYPLADHQRDVLAHLSITKSGDVIAVNGPPGSGKTTMLLSAVAGAWVDAALAGGDPPVIIAASANNQAVTNIIDAFGKDFGTGTGPFAGRWLPDIKSFGAFLASKSRERQAPDAYQYEGFFDALETEDYFNKAQAVFLEKAAVAFPDPADRTVDEIVEALQSELKSCAHLLTLTQTSLEALKATQAKVEEVLGADPQARLLALMAHASASNDVLAANTAIMRAWDVYCADEPLLMSLFNFLPPVRKKRALKARVFLEGQGLTGCPDRPEEIAAFIAQIVKNSDAAQKTDELQAAQAEMAIEDARTSKAEWGELTYKLGAKALAVPEDIDAHLDTTLRFEMFLLATHYWEGRWLLEMQKALPIPDEHRWKKTENIVIPRWHRRMMITPCAVATFASLPGKLGCYRAGDPKGYLFNFIDLLIVDEAGQVLPELAAASFALAKTALVIGDTKQLEPIVGVPQSVDIGNLIGAGILPSGYTQEDLDALDTLGLRTTNGSVMHRAQTACRYHPYPDLDRGLHLFEHRRCYDEIVKYCNDLCYQGTLQPVRGPAPVCDVTQPLGYLHIDGYCRKAGGSNFNEIEAKTIAAWLAAHRVALERKYDGKKLEDIVGIVTPFGRQADELRRACQAEQINTAKMTIGTVHGLQGADRPVIIFSPTYSKHADGGFIDLSKSMLNVAVSRAKDSFMVFGDMDLFSNAVAGTPRQILAQTLMSGGGNALTFEMLPRTDLSDEGRPLTVLRDAAAHDAFIVERLRTAPKSVCIVSPWIVMANARNAGILDAMRAARDAGTEIEVMTDAALTSQPDLTEMRDFCETTGITLTTVRQLHSKIVIESDTLLAIGSYNWLSASRAGQFARHETSFVYQGGHLADEIDLIAHSLRHRTTP